MTARILSGQCLCGSSAYEVADEFLYALNCHCGQCRRSTGAAFKPFAGIEREKLVLSADAQLMYHGDPDGNHDVRCRECGSLLYSVVREARFVHVTLGTLLNAPTLLPTAHIFVGSKAPWYEIRDELPQHDEF